MINLWLCSIEKETRALTMSALLVLVCVFKSMYACAVVKRKQQHSVSLRFGMCIVMLVCLWVVLDWNLCMHVLCQETTVLRLALPLACIL